MKKTIGILGGISAASTIEYYKGITDLYYERYQDYYYPEIIINSLNFQYFTDLENGLRMEVYLASRKCMKWQLKMNHLPNLP